MLKVRSFELVKGDPQCPWRKFFMQFIISEYSEGLRRSFCDELYMVDFKQPSRLLDFVFYISLLFTLMKLASTISSILVQRQIANFFFYPVANLLFTRDEIVPNKNPNKLACGQILFQHQIVTFLMYNNLISNILITFVLQIVALFL